MIVIASIFNLIPSYSVGVTISVTDKFKCIDESKINTIRLCKIILMAFIFNEIYILRDKRV